MQYNLLLISTFIDLKAVNILLESLKYNQNIQLKVILLAQSKLDIDIEKYLSKYNSIDLIHITAKITLSKARNLCIEYICQNNIIAKYVMFPDDDSSFGKEFFERFENEISNDEAYIIDVYEQGSTVKYIRHSLISGKKIKKKHFYAVGSTNMVIPYGIFKQIGLFDEKMGVGAQYGAAEDGDYYIRCCGIVNSFVYTSNLYIFHPKANKKYNNMPFSQLKNRFKNYGEGVVYMLCKHNMWGNALCICFKAWFGALYSIIRGKFKLALVYGLAFYFRIRTFFKIFLLNDNR